MKESEAIWPLVIDLYEAQIAANDGWSDFFEIKKAILRARGFDVPDDLTPEMLPKKMNRGLEKLIWNSLFKRFLDDAIARHPECQNLDELEAAVRADQRKRAEQERGQSGVS